MRAWMGGGVVMALGLTLGAAGAADTPPAQPAVKRVSIPVPPQDDTAYDPTGKRDPFRPPPSHPGSLARCGGNVRQHETGGGPGPEGPVAQGD